MTIEKVFAIEADAVTIWEALWNELGSGEESRFVVEQSHWPERLKIGIELAGMPVYVSYVIQPKDEHCEVAASIEPRSSRYFIYQLLTFGHFRRNYEMLLVQGLANLKRAVEAPGDAEVAVDEVTD